MIIKSGATAWHRIKPGVDLNLIDEIIITYKNASGYGSKIVMQRRYPSQTIMHEGDILVPLSQADTMMLREQSGGMVRMELQYNYVSGAVGKSQTKTVAIGDTLATELVDGSAPDAVQMMAPEIVFFADGEIKPGATAWHRIQPGIALDLIREIIITYKSQRGNSGKIILQKRYPSETEMRDEDILVPLSQQDTTSMRESGGDRVWMELQYNFNSGAVAKSEIETIIIGDTLATEYVEGSAPDDSQIGAKAVEINVDAVILAGGGGGDLPEVSGKDNGKVLTVVNGVWAAAELPTYDGTYKIIPRLDSAAVMATSGKYLAADVTVEKIPVTITSNTAGGKTVIIGT